MVPVEVKKATISEIEKRMGSLRHGFIYIPSWYIGKYPEPVQ
jgi:hypothetical protein